MKKFFVLILLLVISYTSYCQKFNIVYLADVDYASNTAWLNQIKTWGATGINLRIYRYKLDLLAPDSTHILNQANWAKVINAINDIIADSLDVYIRVSMFFNPATYKYNANDYQQTWNHTVMDNPYTSGPGLNLSSPKSFNDRIIFFKNVVNALSGKSFSGKIKMIVPTFSPDDETEFMTSINNPPFKGYYRWLSGYSSYAQDSLMAYLRRKYGSVSKLNTAWQSDFNAIDTNNIRINKYDWETIKSNYTYYPKGRKDFIDFLSSQLGNFINKCASIAHADSFKIGAQFGSIYDKYIEFRGDYQVTPLIKNVDMVICDDIAEYYPNFNFAADYLRSVCNYWNRTNGASIRFGTETNWPCYNYIVPNDLVYYWQQQLKSYYDRGASYLFISHWGTDDKRIFWYDSTTGKVKDTFIVGRLIESGTLDDANFEIRSTAYKKWKSVLNSYKDKIIKNIRHDTTVYLSPIMALYSHDGTAPYYVDGHIHNEAIKVSSIPTKNGYKNGTSNVVEFPLYLFVKPRYPYDSVNTYYNGNCDILTDYMMANSPGYFEKYYNVLYFTASSYYMSNEAYSNLANIDLSKKKIFNATWFTVKGHGKYAFIPGTKNEYDTYRSPKDLIWK